MRFLLLALLSLGSLSGFCQKSDRLLRAEVAVKCSQEFFANRHGQIDRSDVTIVLSLLEKHFALETSLPPMAEICKNDSTLGEFVFLLYDVHFNERVPDAVRDSARKAWLTENYNSIDGLTFYSVFCKLFPLPQDYLVKLDEMVNQGDYEMIHVALQLQNSLKQGCLIESSESKKLKTKLVGALLKEINSKAAKYYDNDMKYESIVMLYYLQSDQDVKPAYIDLILNNQFLDGGWGLNAEAKESDTHSSVLAFWALLEFLESQKK